MCATYTITPERVEDWDFSDPYRVDHVGVMIMKDSGMEKLADLDGKLIGVSQGSTTKQAVTDAVAEEGVTLSDSNFNEYPDYPSINSALESGNIDAFAMDRSTRFMDIGTGAGFPGIPLGIMTGAHGLLVDSVNKKVLAVGEFAAQLGLTALHALHARVEDYASEYPRSQDYVFTRAVAQSNVIIEYAAPLLKNEGMLVLEKARPSEEELEHAARAARYVASTVVHVTFELPHELGHREILIYIQKRKPSILLPRKAGEAKRFPLGE